MVVVAPVTAASQTVVANADRYGGMLHATARRPSFEVTSIRPSAPNAGFGGIRTQPDGVVIRGASIKDVIEFAYAVSNENEFSGGPNWIQTERFDIVAKPNEAEAAALVKVSQADLDVQMRLMLQSLLEERLQLKVSFALREMPLFALIVAKGGFKCKNAAPAAPFASLWRPRYGAAKPPIPVPAPGEQAIHWAPRGWPFWLIATSITYQPELGGRIVVDRTGFDGVYDCELSWTPEGTDAPGSSFFTAIQEQMGLKLQPEKGPVETILIDRVERPSEN
jgi:uncharacterized protein (TIGR03435 family)